MVCLSLLLLNKEFPRTETSADLSNVLYLWNYIYSFSLHKVHIKHKGVAPQISKCAILLHKELAAKENYHNISLTLLIFIGDMCKGNGELVGHLLLHCPIAYELWTMV